MLRGLREAVLADTAEAYAIDFFTNYYRDDENGIPTWIRNALRECDITLP